MKQTFLILCAISAMAFTMGKKPVKPAKTAPAVMKNANDSFSYAFGAYTGGLLKQFSIGSVNMQIFNAAMLEGIQKGDTGLIFDKEAVGKILNEYTRNAQYGANRSEGNAYMNLCKASGFSSTPSGLLYKVIRSGNGIKPRPSDTALVYYTGSYTDSSVFDSNMGRKALKTPCNAGVIPGFYEALQLMDEGSEIEIVIPYNLAYGEEGKRNPYTGETSIEPYKTLRFTLILEKVIYRL